jgi:hypothetical protein
MTIWLEGSSEVVVYVVVVEVDVRSNGKCPPSCSVSVTDYVQKPIFSPVSCTSSFASDASWL